MRVLHTADLHIGYELGTRIDPTTGLNLRVVDYLSTLDYMVGYALGNDIDVFLIAGDIYKNRTPSLTLQREFTKRIVRLLDADKFVVLLKGNHDTPPIATKAHTIEIHRVLARPKLWVIDEVCKCVILKPPEVLNIIGIPYSYDQLKPEEYLAKTLPLVRQLMLNTESPILLTGHCSLVGAKVGVSDFPLEPKMALPMDLVNFPDVDFVAMGDVHKHQVLKQTPPVVYCGSPERCDFNEEKDEKGFVVINFRPRGTTWEFVPLKAREYVTLDYDLTKDPDPAVPLDTLKNKCVRIRVKGRKGQHLDVNTEGVFHCVVHREIVTEDRVITAIKDEMKTEDMVEAYFGSDPEKPELVELAKKLLEEVRK